MAAISRLCRAVATCVAAIATVLNWSGPVHASDPGASAADSGPLLHTAPAFCKNLARQDVEDLRVKVIGGYVYARRTWEEGVWKFNPELNPLYLPGGFIVRGKISYGEVEGITPLRYQSDQKHIVKTPGGWRWEDSDGQWIDYGEAVDARAYPTAFGNRNGTIAALQYATPPGQWPGALKNKTRPSAVLDRLGHVVLTYEYSSLGDVTRVTDYAGRQVRYQDETAPPRTSVTDARGYEWTYTYVDSSSVLMTLNIGSRTDPEGRVTTYSYGYEGLLGEVKDEDGFGVGYGCEYNAVTSKMYLRRRFSGDRVVESTSDLKLGEILRYLNGRTVLQVRSDGPDRIYTDENGNETRLHVDAGHQVTGVTYPNGSSFLIDNDPSLGLPAGVTNLNGVVTRFEYDARGNVTLAIEAAGRPEERQTRLQYDEAGQLIESRQVVDGGSGDRVTRLTYDPYGNVATLTDAEGNVYAMAHDVMGNVTQLTDPRGKLWHYQYDPAGNLLQTIDPLGGQVRYEYNKVGNLVRVTDEAGAVTQYFYNRQDNVFKIIDARQNEWRYEYTEAALLKRTIDPEGHTREYGYDRDGRLTSVKDGSGNMTSIEYFAGRTTANPAKGRLVRITYPTFVREELFDVRDRLAVATEVETGGRRLMTRWEYDPLGNVTSLTMPDSRRSAYAYDGLNRLVQETRTDNQVVGYQWDRWGQSLRVTDPRQLTTTLAYDKLDQFVSELQPGGGLTHYAYDPAGNLQSIVDPRGQEVRFEYDDYGRRQTERMYTTAGGGTPSRSISYGYDPRGILTSYADGDTSGTFVPDAAGNIISVSTNFGPFSKAVQYAYYRNGLVKAYAAADGAPYGYTYDGNGQLQGLTIPSEGAITVNARRWLAPAQVTLPGGSTQQFEYSDRLLPARIASRDASGNVILDYQYTRDDADLIREIATEHGTYRYTYDDAYRLIAADHPVLGLESFTYDGVGNRLPGDPGLASQWTYGNDNELRTTDSAAYEYDAAGNLTRRTGPGGEMRFFYDEQSRLIRAEDGGGNVIGRYAHDPFGRRLWKEVGGTRTYFAYTGEGLAAEFDASGTPIRSYGYEPDTSWTTAPLFTRSNGAYAYYHNDHLGTPRKLTTSAGQVAWSAVYASFGAAQPQVETVANPLRFAGQYFDAETGLHQNFFRDYDPVVGRYVESDPLGLGAGLNRYAYADGNPVMLTDDQGLILFILPAAFLVMEAWGAINCGIDLYNLITRPCTTLPDVLWTTLGCGSTVLGVGAIAGGGLTRLANLERLLVGRWQDWRRAKFLLKHFEAQARPVPPRPPPKITAPPRPAVVRPHFQRGTKGWRGVR